MKTTTGRKFNAPLIHNPEPRISPKEIEKIKNDVLKRHAREFAPIMFETITGARLTKGETPPPPRELFGPLWREGELAILAGRHGVGKTLLAIHLAESLARGVNAVDSGQLRIDSSSKSSPSSSIRNSKFDIRNSCDSPLSTVNYQLAPQPVLYIDLCHSLDQFRQRYMCPSIFPEQPPVKYRFSSRFIRAGFDKDMTVPEAFEGKFLDYFNHSINKLIARTSAKVIIIDDLAALTPTTLSNAAYARVLRTHSNSKRRPAPVHPSPERRLPACLFRSPLLPKTIRYPLSVVRFSE